MERAALQVGPTIKSISAGGGLPVPYRESDSSIDLEQYFRLWDETRNRLSNEFRHRVNVEVEPGRYLVAEAGCLVAEVRSVKQMGEHLFFLIDAGFNDLVRPAMYGAFHPIAVCGADGSPTTDRERVRAIVGGPLCESGDVFTQREGGVVETRDLPMCRVGDYVILEKTGAYGFAMGSNYNSKLRPAEVLIEEGRAKLIRRRETFQGLIRDELIPE